jgi:hypothetical protein
MLRAQQIPYVQTVQLVLILEQVLQRVQIVELGQHPPLRLLSAMSRVELVNIPLLVIQVVLTVQLVNTNLIQVKVHVQIVLLVHMQVLLV